MERSFLAFSALILGAAVVLTTGCTNGVDATPDGSAVTDRLAFGCKYVEIKVGAYGDYEEAWSKTRSARCSVGTRCDELRVESSFEYVGSSSFYSSRTFEDRQTFLGTCDDPVALTDDATSDDPCNSAPTLCAHDPNCLAIRDCFAVCGSDTSCATRCVSHGEIEAGENFVATVECASQGRTSPALHAVFPEVSAE